MQFGAAGNDADEGLPGRRYGRLSRSWQKKHSKSSLNIYMNACSGLRVKNGKMLIIMKRLYKVISQSILIESLNLFI